MNSDTSTEPDPSSGSAAAGSDTTSGPATAAAATPKSCFICFETEDETPGQTWVTPCPCTLDAHERCMLRWIAEMEGSGASSRKKLRCPACNSRIHVSEPFDAVVALGDRYNRLYGRAAYCILASTLMTMGVVGSGYYGLQAMIAFAGPRPTLNWLGLRKVVLVNVNAREPPFSWRDGARVIWKLYLLNLIAPCLLFHRALPNLSDVTAVGISCVYSVVLNIRMIPVTWPPSPKWAFALLPYTSLVYARAYYSLFGAFEARLNRALQGINVAEVDEQPADNGPMGLIPMWRIGLGIARLLRNGGANPAPANAPAPNAANAEANAANAANADAAALEAPNAANAMEDAGRDDEEDEHGEHEALLDLNVPEGDAFDEVLNFDLVIGLDEDDFPAEPAVRPQGPVEPAQAALPIPPQPAQPAQPAQPVQPPAAQPVAQPAAAARPAADVGEINLVRTSLADITMAMATQLMLPRISGLAGVFLEWLLPRAWVQRPAGGRATGMLQEKWGRSLVGGCLFIVLRDAASLYLKYRRVQAKQHRHIKNVNRTRGRA